MSVIVHIGAPKTATSTLQSKFFPKLLGVLFLGKEVDRGRAYEGWRVPSLGRLMKKVEATETRFVSDEFCEADLIAAIKREAGERPVVLSDEGISVFSGVDGVEKVRRIMAIFQPLGPIRVIYCIRDQLELIKSNYVTEHRGEMLRIDGTKQRWFPDFDRYLDIHSRYVCGAYLDSFCYAAALDRYETLVGPGNLYVYRYEDFKQDPVGALQAICDFMGVEVPASVFRDVGLTRVNEHYTSRIYKFVDLRSRLPAWMRPGRLLPGVMRGWLNKWLNSGAPFALQISEDACQRVKQYYRSDNEALHKKRGFRL